MIKVHVLKPILHDKLGTVKPGKVVELQEAQAKHYLQRGAVEFYETKVIRENPLPDAGTDSQSSASPAAPASTNKTVKKSGTGAKGKKTARSS
jgi:hypothetical protein